MSAVCWRAHGQQGIEDVPLPDRREEVSDVQTNDGVRSEVDIGTVDRREPSAIGKRGRVRHGALEQRVE